MLGQQIHQEIQHPDELNELIEGVYNTSPPEL